MFNDERIIIESGKIFRKTNIVALIISVVFLIVRLFLYFLESDFPNTNLGFGLFSTEIVTIIMSLGIILYGELKYKDEVNDERIETVKYNYYNKSIKILLISIIAGYAVSMIDSFNRISYDFDANYIIWIFQVLGVALVYFNFKKKQININYSFINNDNKTYYKHVFKLIIYLGIACGIIYVSCGIVAALIYQEIIYLLTFFIVGIVSILGLGLQYLLLSFLEKIDYDDDKHKVTKAFIFPALICIVILVTHAILFKVTYFIGESDITNKAQLIMKISEFNASLTFTSAIYEVVTLSYILSYFIKNKAVYKCIYIYFIVFVISTIIGIINFIPFHLISTSDLSLTVAEYIVINQMKNYILSYTNLILILLIVIFIITDLKLKKIWIVFPLVRLLMPLVYAYFNLIDKDVISQEFLYYLDALIFASLAIVLFSSRKQHKLNIEKNVTLTE